MTQSKVIFFPSFPSRSFNSWTMILLSIGFSRGLARGEWHSCIPTRMSAKLLFSFAHFEMGATIRYKWPTTQETESHNTYFSWLYYFIFQVVVHWTLASEQDSHNIEKYIRKNHFNLNACSPRRASIFLWTEAISWGIIQLWGLHGPAMRNDTIQKGLGLLQVQISYQMVSLVVERIFLILTFGKNISK